MMTDYGTYTVRPLSKAPRTDLKDVFKVFLSATNVQLKGIRVGEHCQLKVGEDQRRSVFIWPSVEKIQDSVIQTSKVLQRLCGMKLGDKVSLISTKAAVPDALGVVLSEVVEESKSEIAETEKDHWAWVLKYALLSAELISPGLLLENVTVIDQRRSFQIYDINGSDEPLVYRSEEATVVKIGMDDDPKGNLPGSSETRLSISLSGLEGLDLQVLKLNEKISNYQPDEIFKRPPWYRPRPCGIILYGLPGTGKTLLLRKISTAGWRGVFDLRNEIRNLSRTGERVAALRKIFADAQKCQPSIILIDNLETVVGKADSTESSQRTDFTQALCEEFDQLNDGFIFVVAAVQSLSTIDQVLRQRTRFSVEIEIPVPNTKSRAAILKALTGKPVEMADPTLDLVAGRTHGYVGRDLHILLETAAEKAMARARASRPDVNGPSESKGLQSNVDVEFEDFQVALKEVRPSAIREIFVETPETKWADIVGQEEVKKSLEEALIWPAKYKEDMKRFAISQEKGLLLYGPPGCSKTMIARAAATESGHNFLAVRGAELVNMYVGESERAVRELFRKARSVSPSIIFFDEIDAIGTARNDGQHGSLNIVTTLLNELDGIEDLRGVFVLAATNRPETIDFALLRAGRLTTALYVAPPDLEAIKGIFDQRLRQMDIEDDVSSEILAPESVGLSGAEIVGVCTRAGKHALRDQIQSKRSIKVNRDHFRRAQQEVQTIITKDMLDSYEKFALKRSGG